MKHWLLFALLSISNSIGYSQLSYDDLIDLNALCKKEDFEAVKTFLNNEDYNIETVKTNYDHGSYFVLAQIEAKKKIGTRNSYLLRGTDMENIYDEIRIEFNEYNDKKILTVTQQINTDQELQIKYKKIEPIYKWEYENWTRVLINDYELWKEVFKKKYDSIQNYIANLDTSQPNYNLLVGYELMQTGDFELGTKSGEAAYHGYDYSIKKIDNEMLKSYFSKHEFKENENFTMDFFNDNPKYGDLTNYNIQYGFSKTNFRNYDPSLKVDSITVKYYHVNTTLETRFIKGQNTITDNDKFLTFPLIKKGQSYTLKIKFGKIIKTYVLDSGASDMSIDDDTFQYLKNTSQLKNENRLSDTRYELADGSIVQFKRVRLPSFTINNIVIKDIDATIVQNGKPLLLGKSFLDSFKSWKIDNENQTLIVELF